MYTCKDVGFHFADFISFTETKLFHFHMMWGGGGGGAQVNSLKSLCKVWKKMKAQTKNLDS